MSELKRSDRQYVEIEEFAEYELTQCIAYEMAIRDYHYRELADSAVAFYDEHKEDIDWYFGNCTLSFVTDEDYSISDAYSNVVRSNDHLMIITRLKFMLIDTMMVKSIDGNILNIEEQYRDNRLGDKFWDIVEMFGSEIIPDELNEQILEQGASTLTYQEDTKEIQLAEVCERDGYSINTALANSTLSHKDAIQIQSIEDCAKHFETYVLSGWRGDVRIEENFKRPLLKTNSFKVANPKLTVNLSRPLKEIIALITHIKEDIEENKLVTSPIELLGTELKRADNLVCNDKGEKCFDPRGILSTQKKMSDMFYIYDCLKEGYTKRKIQNEVYNYYADKGLENITLDQKTLNKYQRIAIDYIDNRKYEEMLTGVSVDDLS